MVGERDNGVTGTRDELVPKEAYDDLIESSAVFRMTVRDMLTQAGVPTNPGSLDTELTDGLASKLGVKSHYEEIRNHTPSKRTINSRQ